MMSKKLFQKIDKLKQEINGLKPYDASMNEALQERLRIEWTYNSNAIEGNTLTFGETAFFLREGLTCEGKPLKDYLEARNHSESIDVLMEVIKQERRLTESLIKELHALLMKGIEFTYAKGADGKMIKKPLNPGMYKTRPNHVLTLSGKIHKYTDPIHVKDEMESLLKWYHSSKDLHPVEKASVFHYRFAAIHPFDDGNGRMARILMNLILIQDGYLPCIVKNKHRKKYLESLEFADKTGDHDSFSEFIGDELFSTMSTVLRILHHETGFEILEIPVYTLNREDRENLILRTLKSKTLTIGQILEFLPQIKRPTLKSDLKRLVFSKKIKKKGVRKGVSYTI